MPDSRPPRRASRATRGRIGGPRDSTQVGGRHGRPGLAAVGAPEERDVAVAPGDAGRSPEPEGVRRVDAQETEVRPGRGSIGLGPGGAGVVVRQSRRGRGRRGWRGPTGRSRSPQGNAVAVGGRVGQRHPRPAVPGVGAAEQALGGRGRRRAGPGCRGCGATANDRQGGSVQPGEPLVAAEPGGAAVGAGKDAAEVETLARPPPRRRWRERTAPRRSPGRGRSGWAAPRRSSARRRRRTGRGRSGSVPAHTIAGRGGRDRQRQHRRPGVPTPGAAVAAVTCQEAPPSVLR